MAQKIEMSQDSTRVAAGAQPERKLHFEGTVELGSALPDDALSVLFGPESNANGKLRFDGAVRIDGSFQGSITTRALTAGEAARIVADISCTSAVVCGEVVGNITATESVALEGAARVKGDIVSPSLSVAKGARFDGLSRMGSTPAKSRRPNRT